MERTSVLLLLLALSVLFASADVNIDCGSSDIGYTDGNGIIWMGDHTLISTGKSRSVQSTNSVDAVMRTLRVFTSRKKNCYGVPGELGLHVLVRASFYYGNYDGKSKPPSFDLQFDGNHWTTVETEMDSVVYYEAIYVVQSQTMSVCVAQTNPDQFPFISALEVTTLESSMYSGIGSSQALFLKARVAFGTNETIRYLSDPYDRIWVPASLGSGLTVITRDETFIDTLISDNPPAEVLVHAITPSTSSDPISLTPYTNLPSTAVPIYMNLYFSEVAQLDSTVDKRSFQFYVDDKLLPDLEAIVPNYAQVSETTPTNITASSITLVATSDSTLPPLINAMEVFQVSGPLTDGTNSQDPDGLGALIDGFMSLQDWNGDPCLPSPYTWDWVNCSSDTPPRVTALHLSSYDLSGIILPDFSSMDALITIDLHNNSIGGPIPDFLSELPNLKELNLADNAFSGEIPSSLLSNGKLKFDYSGNPDLCVPGKSCGSPPATMKKKKSNTPAIVGATVPTLIVFWVIVGAIIWMKQKRKREAMAASGQNGGSNTTMLSGTPQHPFAYIGQAAKNSLQFFMNKVRAKVKEEVIDQISDFGIQVVQQEASNQTSINGTQPVQDQDGLLDRSNQ